MGSTEETLEIATLDRFFGLSRHQTTPSREIAAGVTTFLTMAYILFVNPEILGKAIELPPEANGFGQLLTATALAAATGTLVMGLLARYPFALAPGMGLNAYFTYTVVLGQQVPWPAALGAVFLSGCVFLVLSAVGIREAILHALPIELRAATGAGIGLFLAMIGLEGAGVIVDHPATLVTLGDLTQPAALLCAGGLLGTAALLALKVPGALLIGITGTSAVAILSGAPVFGGQVFGGFTHGVVQAPAWPVDLVLALDVSGAWDLGIAGIVFTFLFVDLFDTAGTLTGLADRGGYLDSEGRLPRASAAFAADAIGTIAGALLGTSTTTAYIESAAGIEAGGRSGLTAITVAALFLLSIFVWPLAGAVPAAATAPALILVGALMVSSVGRIAWDDPVVAVPAFLTLITMPVTYSIANGISFGIIAWVGLHALTGRGRQVHWIVYGLAGALIARYGWLAGG